MNISSWRLLRETLLLAILGNPQAGLLYVPGRGLTLVAARGGGLSEIFVDADGCPVKEEVYRVAKRYGLKVCLVANSSLRIPSGDWVTLVVVGDGFDEADDWIVDHAGENDIVVSGDIPLAARCLKKGARVLGPTGRVFSDASIGDALAIRDLSAQLRDSGTMTGGPAPFGQRDRSRFLQRLDALVHEVLPRDTP